MSSLCYRKVSELSKVDLILQLTPKGLRAPGYGEELLVTAGDGWYDGGPCEGANEGKCALDMVGVFGDSFKVDCDKFE